MTFPSPEFVLLFVVVSVLYHVASMSASYGHRIQNFVLLATSYVFYGWWDWRFLGLLFGSSVVDYVCARMLDPIAEEKPSSARRRKGVLLVSIAANLGTLAYFKYCNFFIASLNLIATKASGGPWFDALEILLPVGISFIVFQSMSYTIDVYRGELPAQRNFFDFLLYLSFFPQLVAGPIERASRLMPQICNPRQMNVEMFASGLHLMLWGFFKKVVIADNLAPIANHTFDGSRVGLFAVWVGCCAFAFQIYCDFSGYTDIARGVARTLGFDLMLNFKLPYFATNPSAFWQRWHISLSTWLKDYLYIPLGGNRNGFARSMRNLMIVMVLGGLWHGAAWHFVAWGVYQGLLLVAFHAIARRRGAAVKTPARDLRFWLTVVGFFQLTCFGWLIFRANSLHDVWRLTRSAVCISSRAGFSSSDALMLAALVVPLVLFELYQFLRDDLEPWTRWKPWQSVGFNLAMIYGMVFFAPVYDVNFIYFQF